MKIFLENFNPDRPLAITLKNKDGLEIDFNSLSSGEHTIFKLIGLLISSKIDHEYLPKLLLLDEVDSMLHPAMCVNFIKAMKQLSDRQNIPMIIVSHSPSTIVASPKNSVYVLENQGGTIKLHQQSKQQALDILSAGFQALDEKEDGQIAGIRMVISEMPNQLLVEGVSDKIYLDHIIKKYFPHLIRKCNVVYLTGSGSLDTFWDKTLKGRQILVHRRMLLGKKVILIYDCDSQTKKGGRGSFYRFSIKKKSNPIDKGIENLIPQSLVDKIDKHFGATVLNHNNNDLKINPLKKSDLAKWVIENADKQELSGFIDLISKIEAEYLNKP